MLEEFEQYKVQETPNFWTAMQMCGYTGYDAMEPAMNKGWHLMGSWGKDGYDLGSWPLVIVFWRNVKLQSEGGRIVYQVAEYVEGDVTIWNCPSREIQEQVTDEIAFWYWKFNEEEWVKDYETVKQLPADLRGPCRFELEKR